MQGITGSMAMRTNRIMTEWHRSAMFVYVAFKSHCKLLCKTGGAVMLIVATVLALGGGCHMTNVDTSATHRPIGPSQQCAKKYGEVFDLAQLARRDGKSSDVMVRELAVMSGRLNECLSTTPVHVHQVTGSDFSAALGAHPANGNQS